MVCNVYSGSKLPGSIGCAILVARAGNRVGLAFMGAKYLPTIKDQKYNQRYHSKNNPMPVLRKNTPVASVKPATPAPAAAAKKAKS